MCAVSSIYIELGNAQSLFFPPSAMRCARSIFFLACLVSFVFSAKIYSSRSDEPVIETVSLPITVDNQRRYSLNLTVSAGSRNQPLLFTLSTSTGYTSVAGKDCTGCGGGPAFDSSDVPLNDSMIKFTLLEDSWASGPVMMGDCSIEERNQSVWTWNDQLIIVANNSEGIFSSGISGLLGLGNNARTGNFNATPMGNWLNNNPGAANFSFGLALNPAPSSSGDSDSNADGGTLHWVKPDENAMQGQVSFKDLHPNSDIGLEDSGSSAFDSFVLMDSWSFTGTTGVQITKNDQVEELRTVIDPFFSSIFFPQNETRSIYAGVEGASRQVTVSQVSQSTAYNISCDTQMNLTLTFGNVSVTLDKDQLVLQQGDGGCIGAIQEWTDPSIDMYLLGSLYIANIYLIFQGSSSSSGSYGFAYRTPAETKAPLSPVAITGVVLGGAAFLMMVGVILFLYLQHRKRKAHLIRNSSDPNTTTIFDPLLSYSSLPASRVSQQSFLTSRSEPDLIPRPYIPPSSSTIPYSGDTKAERNSRRARDQESTQVQPSSRSRSPSNSRPNSRPTSTAYHASRGSSREHDRSLSTIYVPVPVSVTIPNVSPLSSQFLLVPTTSIPTSPQTDGHLSPGWRTDVRGISPFVSVESLALPRSSSPPPSYASQMNDLASVNAENGDTSNNSHVLDPTTPTRNSHSRSLTRPRSETGLRPPPPGAMVIPPRSPWPSHS
ncbi:acid protease [Dendrothele bispora CBS 962.96]|uniref:Acid protease n=1 Tax=Dendrothele bispora (strain CBS 962.96) TaxID=1314807 RepID=A0A4S8MP55_DENBC|nr:acid protease [Dendrothele bispora CBS 962.96]